MIYSYEIIIRIIIKRLKFVMLKQSKNHYRNRMITELNETQDKNFNSSQKISLSSYILPKV